MSRTVQIAISLLISAAAVWFSMHGVDLGSFWSDLASARLVWLGPMVFFAAASMWLRARRWRLLLEGLGPLGDTPVFYATCIGFMGNMVLPLRAGEAIKPLVIARGGRITMPAALATVAIERLLDMVMLGLFAGITLLIVPTTDFLRNAAQTLVVLVAVGIGLLVTVIRYAPWIERQTHSVADRLPSFAGRIVREGAHGFLRGVGGLRDARTLLAVFVYSALVWLVAAFGFITGAWALDIAAPALPLGFATTVVVAAAVSVPSAPGFIGVFWAGSEIALGLFGVPKSMGFTFGVLNWLVQMVVIIALGMWSMSRLNLSLGDVKAAPNEISSSA
ncbi:MAG TPA: lysylphosphatidylglycerol synthase transmembrane domain-containing protein [Candidatus Binatia bacterium]